MIQENEDDEVMLPPLTTDVARDTKDGAQHSHY